MDGQSIRMKRLWLFGDGLFVNVCKGWYKQRQELQSERLNVRSHFRGVSEINLTRTKLD